MGRGFETAKLKRQPVAGPQSFTLPHGFLPRKSYQWEVFTAFERGCKRFVLCWHRRSGKDRLCLAVTTVAMAQRPGLYLHIYPTNELARKAMWIAQTREGRPFLDAFPSAWLDGEPNKTEMLIKVKALPGQPSGSIWKLTGAEDPNSLRGLNPLGVVLSEYSEQDPRVWQEVLSPILAENGGWVIFNFTPKGKNHSHDIYQIARQHPETWFCSLKTVADTKRDAPNETGGPVVPASLIDGERQQGIPEEIIQQEYYCSFDGYLRGTIYGDCLHEARRDGRITRVPYEITLPVGVAFDFGRDGTACVFYQVAAREIRIIDYLAFRGKGIDHLIKSLKDGKPYLYGRLIVPFDATHDDFTEAKTTADHLEDHWPGMVAVMDRMPVDLGIGMVRSQFRRLVFDEAKCSLSQDTGRMPSLLDSLGNYRRAWDDKKGDYSTQPVHDQFSHGADAFRYAAQDNFSPPAWGRKDDYVVTDCVTKFNVFTQGRGPALIGR